MDIWGENMNVKELKEWLDTQQDSAVVEVFSFNEESEHGEWEGLDFDDIRTAVYGAKRQ